MTPNIHALALEEAAIVLQVRTSFREKEAADITGRIVKAYLAALAKRGLKVTPREPTPEQNRAGETAVTSCNECHKQAWRAMHDSSSWPPIEKGSTHAAEIVRKTIEGKYHSESSDE